MSWRIDENIIKILDLEIWLEQDVLKKKTHFKPVNRNSYLSMNSCHRNPWLINTPRGQLTRLRRNFTEKEDYKQQVILIKARFTEKGYKRYFIQQKKINLPTLREKLG